MNARERRKAAVWLFGRKRRCDAGVPRTAEGWARMTCPPPVRAYRRVSFKEVILFIRLWRKGRSLRWIGRRHGRSHHTVARWLARRNCQP